MEFTAFAEQIRSGRTAKFPANANTLEFAQQLDAQDSLGHLRNEFIIPTKGSLKKKSLNGTLPGKRLTRIATPGILILFCAKQRSLTGEKDKQNLNGHANGVNGTNGANGSLEDDETPSVYFCGNSLGVPPKAVKEYIHAQLETWASIGVNGHFQGLDNSPLVCWQDMAEDVAKKSAHIVGALPEEVVMMNTLTANLHFLMASFYRPTEKKHKIILEWRPFPSDHVSFDRCGIRMDLLLT